MIGGIIIWGVIGFIVFLFWFLNRPAAKQAAADFEQRRKHYNDACVAAQHAYETGQTHYDEAMKKQDALGDEYGIPKSCRYHDLGLSESCIKDGPLVSTYADRSHKNFMPERRQRKDEVVEEQLEGGVDSTLPAPLGSITHPTRRRLVVVGRRDSSGKVWKVGWDDKE